MTPLFGHEAAVAAFRDALDSGKLHHAWLITGPPGVGKSMFAKGGPTCAGAGGQARRDATGLAVAGDHLHRPWLKPGSHPDL